MLKERFMFNNSRDFLKGFPALSPIDYFFAKEMSQKKLLQAPIVDDEQCFYAMCALSWTLRQGHSCLPLASIAGLRMWQQEQQVESGFKFASLEVLQQALNRFRASAQQAVVFENNQLYMRRYWTFENEIATDILQKNNQQRLKSALTTEQIKKKLDNLFPKENDQLDWQKIAVANSLGYRFSVISGGPGTGKTYTACRLLIMLQYFLQSKEELKIALAAPTGKAANRLIESIELARQQLSHLSWAEPYHAQIPQQAKTLHRLLGMGYQQSDPKYSQKKPLPYDIILLDEASMIDLPNMCRLLRAIASHAILILLGDAEQLPSIETGNILSDLANHDGFSASDEQWINALNDSHLSSAQETTDKLNQSHQFFHYLKHSRRFGGKIAKLAEQLREGDKESSLTLLKEHLLKGQLTEQWQDISWASMNQCEQILKQLVEQYYLPIGQLSSPKQALIEFAKFRILTPFRQTDFGVDLLNKKIEYLLHQKQSEIVVGKNYHARPIIILQNCYELGLFNGDIGILWKSKQSHELRAYFAAEYGIHSYSIHQLPQYEAVYAMTIHKSQGSEFKQLAIIIENDVEATLINQSMIYTAMTRAKEKLLMICEQPTWKKALDNKVERYSGLKEKLREK